MADDIYRSFNDYLSNNDVDVELKDSFNDNSTDTDVDVKLKDSLNDNSTHTDVDVDDSFNDNSTHTDVDVKLDDSFNEDSYNTTLIGSGNVAGPREYNTLFNNVSGAGGLGGAKVAGDVYVNNNNTITDQSVNQNISTGHGGDVNQFIANDAVTASGAGSIAAGDDVSFTSTVDNSVDISASYGSAVNIGNTTSLSNTIDSYNTTIDKSDNSTNVDVELEDSFNTYDVTKVSIDESFNREWEYENEQSWTVSDNTWASTSGDLSPIGEDNNHVDLELEF